MLATHEKPDGDALGSLVGMQGLLAALGKEVAMFIAPEDLPVPREYRGFATGLVQMMFGLGSLLGISLGGALLTALFRRYSGIPDATPSADLPAPFVAAMNTTCAVCFVLVGLAVVASLMRGRQRVEAAESA